MVLDDAEKNPFEDKSEGEEKPKTCDESPTTDVTVANDDVEPSVSPEVETKASATSSGKIESTHSSLENQSANETSSVTVKVLHREQTAEALEQNYEVSSLESSVDDLRAAISTRNEVSPDRVRMIFRGHVLENGKSLSAYKIDNTSVVHAVIRPANVPPSNEQASGSTQDNGRTQAAQSDTNETSNTDALSSLLSSVIGNAGQNGGILQLSFGPESGRGGRPSITSTNVTRQLTMGRRAPGRGRQTNAGSSNGENIPGLETQPGGASTTNTDGEPISGDRATGTDDDHSADPLGDLFRAFQGQTPGRSSTQPDSSQMRPRASNGLLALTSLLKQFHRKSFNRRVPVRSFQSLTDRPLAFPIPGFYNSTRFGLLTRFSRRSCPSRMMIRQLLNTLTRVLGNSDMLGAQLRMRQGTTALTNFTINPEIYDFARILQMLPVLCLDMAQLLPDVTSGNYALSPLHSDYAMSMANSLQIIGDILGILRDFIDGSDPVIIREHVIEPQQD